MNREEIQEKVGEIAAALINYNYGDAEQKTRNLYSALCPRCEGKGWYKEGSDITFAVTCSCCDITRGGYGLRNEEEAPCETTT